MRPEAPWLTPAVIAVAACIASSHQRAFGRPLLAGSRGGGSGSIPSGRARLLAQELFAAATVVLAHDGADPGSDPGPRLIYANRAALQLWRRPWTELVGMPSRLTAEPAERAGRAQALASVQQQHAIHQYCGIRIDSHGRRFQIRRARVWTLWRPSASGKLEPFGQAAAFNDWFWL